LGAEQVTADVPTLDPQRAHSAVVGRPQQHLMPHIAHILRHYEDWLNREIVHPSGSTAGSMEDNRQCYRAISYPSSAEYAVAGFAQRRNPNTGYFVPWGWQPRLEITIRSLLYRQLRADLQ
jgi:hypothetical protein